MQSRDAGDRDKAIKSIAEDGSDDSDLDIVKQTRKDLNLQQESRTIDGDHTKARHSSIIRSSSDHRPNIRRTPLAGASEGGNTTEDEGDYVPSSPERMKPRGKTKLSRRVEWCESSDAEDYQPSDPPTDVESQQVDFSEEEDPSAAYRSFKNRKSVKRKRDAAINKQAKAMSSARAAKNATIVGRKPKRQKPNGSSEVRAKKGEFDGEGVDARAGLEDLVPYYIKDRMSKVLRAGGWKFPPEDDGIELSDDEASDSQREKPQFNERSGVKPQRQKQDIKLKDSRGVIPAPVAQWLRDYQVDGVRFLHRAFVRQRGAILGDDMGLGKTIQVISFLTAAFGKKGTRSDAKRMRKMRRMDDGRWYPRVMIICPGGLMQNWQDELEAWGWWQYYVYHGSTADKEAAFQAAKKGRLEIMITTYATYRLNRDLLNTIDWDCIIADECHTIKSKGSEITSAMDEVNAMCRIGLTGTAIQNKYEELWTLLNWSNPGRFGTSATWKHDISTPLKVGQAHDATHEQLAKARKTADHLVEKVLPGVFLRRMKTLIADQLPKKSDRVVFCQLTEKQAEAYENFVESDMVVYIRSSSDPCDCDSGKKRGWCCYIDLPNGRGQWNYHAFPCMVTLQKLSNHLALLLPASNDKAEKRAKDLENMQIALPNEWKDLYRRKDKVLQLAGTRELCGKWKVLKRLLDYWHSNGDKALVFSHSVRLLHLLKGLFDVDGTKYNFSYLDGSMSYDDRAKAVADFNSDPRQFVFLISTKAGGVGLNITSANKVVVVDPNWNPAYDLQAQDRAYRIGQTRDVEVFRLVSAGTIEEIVYARQIYKQQQANIGYTAGFERRYFKGVMDESGKKGELFGLKNLFSFEDKGYLLRDIVNKTNVAEVKAGVSVVDFDVAENEEDDDDDDVDEEEKTLGDDVLGIADDESADSLSQMKKVAEAITRDDSQKRGKKKYVKRKGPDPINAILEKAGVKYTHENSEVTGESKMERYLADKARQLATDPERANKRVFEQSQSQSQHASSRVEDEVEELTIPYKYGPPEEVRRRLFCGVAAMMGYHDPVEFGLHVEKMTQDKRRQVLDRFYRLRRGVLFGKAREEEE